MSTENTLWMGDIEPWMNESLIAEYFHYFNINPSSIKLIKDRETNINKNYCFINFDNVNDSNNALITLNGKKIPNTNINFKLNWADYNSIFSKSLYVGNLNTEVDDIELYKLFKNKYNSVHHASVVTDKGVSKGYGFVIFRKEDEYLRSLNEMNGVSLHGNVIKVAEQKRKEDEENINNHKHRNHLENEKQYKKYGDESNKKNLNNHFVFNKKIHNNSNINQNVNKSCNININDNIVDTCKNINVNGFYDINNYYNSFQYNNQKMNSYTDNSDQNLEILDKIDEMTLIQKISQSINKTWAYYKNLYSTNEIKLRRKYIFLI